MAHLKIFQDSQANSLVVWFGNPNDEYIYEETGDEIILMKNKLGQVIGFEKLNFSHQLVSLSASQLLTETLIADTLTD